MSLPAAPDHLQAVTVITGAGSGIGRACALHLAAAGARVVLADLSGDAARAVAQEVRDAGGYAHAVEADAGDPAEVDTLYAEAAEVYGAVTAAVHNAGISAPLAAVDTLEDDAWRTVLRVNLDGVFYGVRAAVRAMRPAGGGAIVNIASVLGCVGGTHSAPYVASKHGVVGLTRAAAIDCAASGIRVNAVAPGFIETPLLRSGAPGMAEALTRATPQRRLGTPQEVAEIVAWLLSDRASFVTGACYSVDGGYLAQ